MFNSSEKQRNILIVFILFLFILWGGCLLPLLPLPYVSFVNLTETKPFTIKEIDMRGPFIIAAKVVTVKYSDTEKTYAFFSDKPLPFVFQKNWITKEKAEEIVKGITNGKIYHTYLTRNDSELYWNITVEHGHYNFLHYKVNCETGKVEKSDEGNH